MEGKRMGDERWVRARAQVGIQEKTAFVAQGKKLSGAALYSPIISIPATIELLLVRLRHLARLGNAK